MRFSGRVKRILVGGGVVSIHEILWQSETDISWGG